MDWLEDLYEKIKGYIKRVSLKKAMCIYIFIAVICVFFLWLITVSVCNGWQNLILDKYEINFKNFLSADYLNIEAACEKVAILDEGNIIFNGSVFELLERAKGKIYEAVISRFELSKIKEKYNVTSMINEGTLVKVRFGAKEEDKIINDAVLCEPNLEDAYMYLMSLKGGDK